jgi:hypothetical protein
VVPASHPVVPASHPVVPASHPLLPASHPLVPASDPSRPATHPSRPTGHPLLPLVAVFLLCLGSTPAVSPIAVAQIVAAFLAAPVAVAMLTLLGHHARLVAHNKTTIEHMEGVRAEVVALLSAGRRRRSEHPYDLGSCANLHEVCQDANPLLWLWPPTKGSEGGTSFTTAYDASSDPFPGL